MIGLVVGVGAVFSLARFIYQPKIVADSSMKGHMEKQKQNLSQFTNDEFNVKASEQLESLAASAISVTNTAKDKSSRSELRQFAVDSTYSWAYNREGARIILEDMGVRTKIEDKH